MSDIQHVIRIIAHVVQALVAILFLYVMWKWSRPKKEPSIPKEQLEAAEACAELISRTEKEALDCILTNRYYK